MELNRKARRYLSSNKNKNKMEVTNEQKLAYEQIIKLMNDNQLEFNVSQTYNIEITPKKEVVQQAPVEEVKITDVK